MKKVLLFLIFANYCAFSQTVLENNPTGLKWLQVNTPNFRVLFPEGFDFQAQRIASTLERIRSAEARSMGKEPRKISIVLQTQSSVSNGFVSMFPRRSEFYTMPSQNYNFIGSNDWLNLLASHEYRHIVQYQHATRGFNKLLFYLFGTPTLAGMAHAAAPDWFWEGDAVATETAFTPSGRGRIPAFNLLFRTNFLEGRTFNYHKQYLRSYKHNIPNQYVLGFNMVSYLRRRTNDPDIWEKITQRSWNLPFIPFAFSNAIRNKTGMSVTKLYREMASDLKKEWKAQTDSLTLSTFETVTHRSTGAYTDYLYPQPQEDGSVIALKEGIGDIATFVRLRNGREEKIFTPGFLNDPGFLTVNAGVIAWNEYGYDPRWQVKNYSLIKAYDLKNEVRLTVSNRDSRYSSAALSPDGTRIATVRSDENYRHALLVLEYPSGKLISEFENPENYFFAMPRWSGDGKTIAVLKIGENGKTITLVDADAKTLQDVLPVSHENVGHPVLLDNLLLFNSPVSGIDNIYALDLNTRQRFQVTSAKYGAFNPMVSPDKKTIYYNEQTRDGMDVVRAQFNPSEWKQFEPATPGANLYDHLVEQEGKPDLFNDIPQGNFPVKKFPKWKHAINPFSWGFLIDNDLARIDVGIASQDILSTTSLSAGYTYDLAESTGAWRAGLSYQGWFPIIDVNYSVGDRSVDEDLSTVIINGTDTSVVSDTYAFNWREQTVSAGIRIPLITTRSKYSTGVSVQNYFGLTTVTEFKNDFNNTREYPWLIRNNEAYYLPLLDYVDRGNLAYNYFNLTGYRLLKRSSRDFISKLGQAVAVNYYSTPYGGTFEGGLFSTIGYLYFPGLFKHHSIYGHIAYQKTMLPEVITENDYLFRNTVPLPRGLYDYIARFRTFYSTSVNYALPLWYPDISLGPLLNVQRIRLNLFADYASGEGRIFDTSISDTYLSAGGELVFDINILRFLPQLDLGVRYSYGIDPSVTNFEVLIGAFNF